MADEEKKTESAAADAAEENAKDTGNANADKRENAFAKFFAKTKQSVNDSILEVKIRTAFDREHESFNVYTKNELLTKKVTGSIRDGVLTVFGDEDIKSWSVVVANKDEKAYYVLSTEPATVTAEVDGVTYERIGTAVFLDENVEEVNVVKAGKRYYVYKGPVKK